LILDKLNLFHHQAQNLRILLSVEERRNWEEKADRYAREGFRVLAFGRLEGEGDEEMEFLGLALLWDPPRPEAPDAIRRAQDAGIRVIMVTGDHPATALAVAHEVGIRPSRVLTGLELETMPAETLSEAVKEANVFAGVSPEHKLRVCGRCSGLSRSRLSCSHWPRRPCC
jgi:Ca2+-transporting ATPase